MTQDNDRIPIEEEPISLEGLDDGPSTVEIADDDSPISIEGVDDEPISLEAEGPSGMSISHKASVRGGGAATGEHEFKRPLQTTGTGASRCRVFRSKISVPALEGLQEHVNTWLDSDEIDVKHVGHVIGTMHGKIDEDNFIVMVWY